MNIFDKPIDNMPTEGDKVFWDYLKDNISEDKYEVMQLMGVEACIIDFFDSDTNKFGKIINTEISHNRNLFVTFDWWSEVAIPELQQRLNKWG